MMTGKTADEYIKQFKIWAAESEVTQDRPLIEWFMKGLANKLQEKILNMETPLTIIIDWYNTALKFNNQWRRAQAVAQRLRGGQDQKKKGLSFQYNLTLQ